MTNYILKSNPPITSSEILFPNIAELLFQPMFLNANIEEVYRFGTDFMREVIDMAPIKNDRKYVSTTFMLQLVDENTRTVRNQFGYKDEWHIDGDVSPFDEDMRSHIMLSDCQCMTEFLANPVSIELDSNIKLSDFNLMINRERDNLKLVGEKMKPNRFYSFTNYLHRTSQPNGLELRYMVRFIESDRLEHTPLDDSYLKVSSVFNGFDAVKSIERNAKSIILYRR